MRDFTEEKVLELDVKTKKKTAELRALEKTTEAEMWESELDMFLQEYRKIYASDGSTNTSPTLKCFLRVVVSLQLNCHIGIGPLSEIIL